MARPLFIADAGFISVGQTQELPVDPLTDEEYAGITLKSLTNTIVYSIWYETSMNEDGQGIIHTWPVPSAGGTLVLYVPTPLEEITVDSDGLNSDLVVPPGWRLMLVTNLALLMANYFKIVPSQNLKDLARNSKRNVKRSNSKPMVMRLPNRLRRGRYNIITDFTNR